MGMTTRGAWIREATETDALECGAAHHAIAFEPRVDRETPRVGGGRHGAFVCVPCARESRGAWTGRTRQRQWTGRAPARVSFEFGRPFANQKRSSFFTGLARTESFFFARFRVRRVSRLVTKRRALSHRVVLARRASREPGARLPSVPCSQPGTGDRAGSRVSRVVHRVSSATFQSRKARAGSSRERGSEAPRRSKRSAWRPSIVSVSRLALVLSRVSMLTAPASRTRAARRPSDGALATLRRPLPETAASSAKKTLRAVDGARPTLSYPRLLMNGNASRPAGASRTCLNLHWSPL